MTDPLPGQKEFTFDPLTNYVCWIDLVADGRRESQRCVLTGAAATMLQHQSYDSATMFSANATPTDEHISNPKQRAAFCRLVRKGRSTETIDPTNDGSL